VRVNGAWLLRPEQGSQALTPQRSQRMVDLASETLGASETVRLESYAGSGDSVVVQFLTAFS